MKPDDTLNYIADMARELEAMAARAGHEKVAYMLRLVRSECETNVPPVTPSIEEDTSELPN